MPVILTSTVAFQIYRHNLYNYENMKNLIFHLISSISNNFTCSGPLGFSAFLIPFLCYYQRLKNLTFSPRKDGSLYYLVFIPRRVVHAFDYRKHIPNQK